MCISDTVWKLWIRAKAGIQPRTTPAQFRISDAASTVRGLPAWRTATWEGSALAKAERGKKHNTRHSQALHSTLAPSLRPESASRLKRPGAVTCPFLSSYVSGGESTDGCVAKLVNQADGVTCQSPQLQTPSIGAAFMAGRDFGSDILRSCEAVCGHKP